ncbi:MAG: prepilin-type N-terminal cleavage/methylation domain-containing protein [Gammaproteobacteria bacterium]|nr:prepilin-type N-terminal cleavage/methylation domain-containing protein [Gammaproteobacteria bacterium]
MSARIQRAFTLLEVMIILAILSITSAIAIVGYSGYVETSKVAAASAQIRALSLLIADYANENGNYPTSLNDIGNQNLVDPWGNPYTYNNLIINAPGTSQHNTFNISIARKDGNLVPINTHYDLYSSGKDGESQAPLRASASKDDVIYANDGGYIGLAREF